MIITLINHPFISVLKTEMIVTFTGAIRDVITRGKWKKVCLSLAYPRICKAKRAALPCPAPPRPALPCPAVVVAVKSWRYGMAPAQISVFLSQKPSTQTR